MNVKKKNGVHIRTSIYVGYLLMKLHVSSCPLCCISASKNRPFLAFVINFLYDADILADKSHFRRIDAPAKFVRRS